MLRNKIIKLAFIFILFLIFLGGMYILLTKNKIGLTGTSNQPALEFNNLKPGKSSREDVVNALGDPVQTLNDDQKEILEYNSNNPNYNNLIYIQKDKVSFIKEIITLKDNKNDSEIISRYGQPKYVLYGPHSGASFNLYVYPDKGIAFVGQIKSGALLEIWYFSPTTYQSFKTDYAEKEGYTETKKLIQ